MDPDPRPGAAQPAEVVPSRHADRASFDRARADAILAAALIGHLGVVDDRGRPVVLPVAVAPDGDRVLVHGSTGSRLLRRLAAGAPACLTVTHLDGLVLASSAYESSMNYRSLVVHAVAEVLEGDDKERALRVLTEHLAPGRWGDLRPMARREVAATLVLALPLGTFSVKSRSGGTGEDLDTPAAAWVGQVPIRVVAGTPVPEPGTGDAPAPQLPAGLA